MKICVKDQETNINGTFFAFPNLWFTLHCEDKINISACVIKTYFGGVKLHIAPSSVPGHVLHPHQGLHVFEPLWSCWHTAGLCCGCLSSIRYSWFASFKFESSFLSSSSSFRFWLPNLQLCRSIESWFLFTQKQTLDDYKQLTADVLKLEYSRPLCSCLLGWQGVWFCPLRHHHPTPISRQASLVLLASQVEGSKHGEGMKPKRRRRTGAEK